MLKRLASLVLVGFVLAACSILQEETVDTQVEEVAQEATEIPATVEATSEAAMIEVTNTAVMIEPTTEPTAVPVVVEPTAEPVVVEPTAAPVENAYNAPDWVNLPMVNARTGETFTLADFAGRTVFVEPMATWCPNCRTQQGYVTQAMDSLNSDDFVFISVSVGENVSNETLASYAERNSFPQIFVVASPDISNALVEQFGFSALNPPSTPHFTISPAGTVSGLSTGSHRAEMLIEEVTTVHNS